MLVSEILRIKGNTLTTTPDAPVQEASSDGAARHQL
jgi:hypothetical protein